MNLRVTLVFLLGFSSVLLASPTPDYYKAGETFYSEGRRSEAMESFEEALRHKQRAPEAQAFIDKIRRETVESIRNKALTGASKSNWQSKYYYINQVDNNVNAGVSIQELFERDSVNFRPGAIDALHELALALSKADNKEVHIDIVNEINQDVAPNKEVLAQQQAAVFSYLSLAARGQLPRF
jgi:tetratricopeptide (TPR) repeat protein